MLKFFIQYVLRVIKDMSSFSLSINTEILGQLSENIKKLPDEIYKIIEVSGDIKGEAKEKLLKAVQSMRIDKQGFKMNNPEIYPKVDAVSVLKMMVYGSGTLKIKPQLYLLKLLLK